MSKRVLLYMVAAGLFGSMVLCGCVERKLTIKTEPPGATVALNDEEIGQSPVTVGFNWYGDYCVRISKEGFQTLNTHHELEGPWYDDFPFDFFAQILSPKRIVDSYEWTFELSPMPPVSRDELIRNAEQLKERLP